MTPNPLRAKRRMDRDRVESQALSLWKETCGQFEEANGCGFQSLPFSRAIVAVRHFAIKKWRVPLRADYRDRMLTAIVQTEHDLAENQPALWEFVCSRGGFEALKTLVVFWTAGPEIAVRELPNHLREAQGGIACFCDAIRDHRREERDGARLIREYEAVRRQSERLKN